MINALLLTCNLVPLLRSLALMPSRAPTPVAQQSYGGQGKAKPKEVYELGGITSGAEGRMEGQHGTGFRFMPISAVAKDSAPVVIAIAGFLPGCTAEQLLAPVPIPFAAPGTWNYFMLQGDAPGGFTVLPGDPLLDLHPDTVALVVNSGELGIELQDRNEHEVLAIINRADPATTDPGNFFDNMAFYAFADPAGQVSIRWYETIPDGHRVLGRLLYTQIPFVKKAGGSGGFAETDDEFEF